jgi:hypothetical protein
MKALVASLPYTNVFYTARKKGPIKDYKAGNLNAGLAFSRALPWSAALAREDEEMEAQLYGREKPEESLVLGVLSVSSNGSRFVAGLDADMIPEPHWRRSDISIQKESRYLLHSQSDRSCHICWMMSAWVLSVLRRLSMTCPRTIL